MRLPVLRLPLLPSALTLRLPLSPSSSSTTSFDASGDTSDGALAASLRLGLRLDYGDAPVTTKRMAKRHLEEKKRSASVGLGH